VLKSRSRFWNWGSKPTSWNRGVQTDRFFFFFFFFSP
jgi:hypothetical protein